jgi:magnesium transporter
MLRLVTVTPGGVTVAETGAASLPPALPDESWFWLDVGHTEEQDVRVIAAALDLEQFAIDDVLSPTEFPLVDDFEDQLFLVTHTLGVTGDRLKTVELDVFLTSSFIVTFHREEIPGIEWTLARLVDTNAAPVQGPDAVLATVLETGARRIQQLVDALDGETDRLEDLAIAGHPDVVGGVQALRRDVIVLRRVLAPERDMVRALSRTPGNLGLKERRRIESVHDDYSRIVESLDAARSLLGTLLETYRSTVSERMNEVMKVLTVFSAIVLPLSLIAGLYGMNFANMPELHWRWAYFTLLGFMAAVASSLWVYFARRGFIGGPRVPRVDRAIGRGLAGFVQLTTTPIRAVVKPFMDDQHQ